MVLEKGNVVKITEDKQKIRKLQAEGFTERKERPKPKPKGKDKLEDEDKPEDEDKQGD